MSGTTLFMVNLPFDIHTFCLFELLPLVFFSLTKRLRNSSISSFSFRFRSFNFFRSFFAFSSSFFFCSSFCLRIASESLVSYLCAFSRLCVEVLDFTAHSWSGMNARASSMETAPDATAGCKETSRSMHSEHGNIESGSVCEAASV